MDHGTQPTQVDFINPAFAANSYQPSYDGQGQWTHSFGSNATNQFVYAGSYYRAIFTQQDPGLFPMDVFGYGFNLSDLGGTVYNFPQGRNVTQYQFVDDFSWIKGAHALKFGANFRRYDITDYTFSVLNNPLIYERDPLDFYNGTAYLYRERVPSRASQPVAMWGLGVYAQDEWRVNKSLQLTFALRLEHNSNPVCQLNCASQLNGNFYNLLAAGAMGPDTPYNQFVNSGLSQVYQGTDALNVSPRFGFAWSPGGSDKTVVRGGFGIFYDALPGTLADPSMRNMPGLVEVRVPNGLWADPGPTGDQASVMASANAIMSGFSQNASYNSLKAQLGSLFRVPAFTNYPYMVTPYYEQWSFGIQQAIGDKTSVSLGYNGNRGVHIPIQNWPNAYGAGGPFPDAPPTSVFTNVGQYTSSGISNYNDLSAGFNQRMAYGFTIQANYMWGHAIDEVSNGGTGVFYNANSSINSQMNPYCLRCNNYGPADYDIRHSFNASYVWQTPWKFNNSWVNGAFGGWTMSQNFFARTGLPWTATDSNAAIGNYAGANSGYASVVPGVVAQQNCSNGLSICANINAFTTPASGFSNQIRNGLRGPGFFDSDFSINKNFKLTERMAFGVGANFYNVFNHPNFQNPSTANIAAGEGSFGTITQMAVPPTGPYGSFFANLPSARMIQFQGKIIF